MATIEVPPAQFVCPFCGWTADRQQSACDRCESTLLVSREDETVYTTIMPLCGR